MNPKTCEWVQLRMLEYVRKELPKSQMVRILKHLRSRCVECWAHKVLEDELNKTPRSV
jgi:hypothetical protein